MDILPSANLGKMYRNEWVLKIKTRCNCMNRLFRRGAILRGGKESQTNWFPHSRENSFINWRYLKRRNLTNGLSWRSYYEPMHILKQRDVSGRKLFVLTIPFFSAYETCSIVFVYDSNIATLSVTKWKVDNEEKATASKKISYFHNWISASTHPVVSVLHR